MPQMENNGGDRLARGAASHTFRPMGEKKTQKQWGKIFAKKDAVVKVLYILTCPVHGTYTSDREAYLSGGYPLLDASLAMKCKVDRCGEVTDYAGYELVDDEGYPVSGGSDSK